MAMNKRGLTMITLIVLIFVCLVVMVILGVVSWGIGLADDSISELDIQIGTQSFQEVYNETLKIGLITASTTMPQIISMGVMLGLIILMMLVGHFSPNIGRMWILLDIFILIIAEAIAVSVSDGFMEFINIDPALLSIYSNNLSEGASFLINLPKIIPVIGFLVMLVTYIKVRKNKEDEGTASF